MELRYGDTEWLKQTMKAIEGLKDAELADALRRIADDQEYRAKWAAALRMPIRQYVQEMSIARQVLMVDPLGPNGEPRYPVDTEAIHLAFNAALHNTVPVVTTGISEVWVPTHPIEEGIEFLQALARRGQASLVQRRVQLLRDAFVRRESELLYMLMDASVKTGGNYDSEYNIGLTANAYTQASVIFFADLFNKLETKGREPGEYQVRVVLVSHRTLNDIRMWATTNAVDETTRREIFVEGGRRTLWGATLIPWNRIPDTEAWAIDVNKWGVMPIRDEISTVDDPTAVREFKVRVLGYEDVGMGVVDRKAIVRGQITRP